MTLPNDRSVLRRLASQVNEGVILEIGSKNGLSTRAICEAANVPVYCIDMWDLTFLNDPRLEVHLHDDSKFKEYLKDYKVTAIKGISGEVAKVWDKPIGLLFIDGDHSYQGCMTDYRGFARHIVPGGIIAIHDHIEKYHGVTKAVNVIQKSPVWTDWTQEGFSTIWARRA